MIKFFRKIRRNLLSEGKTRKYLKYAIGEIILVVIGILIALQINNWNENRKSSKIRNNYYEQVLQDLAKDTIYINRSIINIDSRISKYQNYLEKLPKAENINDVVPLIRALDLTFRYTNFNTNTIESLISTGDIKLMPDEIRNALLDLRTTQNEIIKITSGNYNVYLEDSQNAIGLGLANFTLNVNPKLLNQLIREQDIISAINITNGTFTLKNFTEKNLLKDMQNLLESTKELSELIREELKK
ncbi:MAG: hypothetical protein BM563_10815 [Bacteroidetes bacterium MedPE-SWsnd-G1]|uniref:DUF6090 family protein n=1 Tax=Urechidicola vernalis TaxID=3075600 RepID=A0ABU2Y5R5_9FLAO|nr:DUF6090 family protein [Urechidicola sp. P050]MDT0553022.1 DUF6090 family protein [Urechidicola sp. P050]OIQ36463.1 MAG: hypothetical protein BM563_10815 [Bacteroidetes bacterium MedPE-SWsnd-G1]